MEAATIASMAALVKNLAYMPLASVQFGVKVDQLDKAEMMGFTQCEGLNIELEVQTLPVGGLNGYEYKIPGRMKYGTVKLTKPLTAKSTEDLPTWVASYNKRGKKPGQVTITVYGVSELHKIATYILKEAFPQKWTGPQFKTDGNALLTETIEIVHHGIEVETHDLLDGLKDAAKKVANNPAAAAQSAASNVAARL